MRSLLKKLVDNLDDDFITEYSDNHGRTFRCIGTCFWYVGDDKSCWKSSGFFIILHMQHKGNQMNEVFNLRLFFARNFIDVYDCCSIVGVDCHDSISCVRRKHKLRNKK